MVSGRGHHSSAPWLPPFDHISELPFFFCRNFLLQTLFCCGHSKNTTSPKQSNVSLEEKTNKVKYVKLQLWIKQGTVASERDYCIDMVD